MGSQWILLACIFVPLLGAFLLPILGKSNTNGRNLAALLLVLISFACAVLSLKPALAGQPLSMWLELPQGLSMGLLADSMAAYAAMIFTLAAAIVIFFSFGYMEHYENQNEYYVMLTLLTGAAMGVVFSTNLILIYAFWELSSVCCWRLLGIKRQPEDIRQADKAFMVNIAGSLLMLMGFIGVYMQMGTFNLLDMQGRGVDNGLIVLMLCGVAAKSAILPLHNWLPHTAVSPASVTALVDGAVVVNLGLYTFARLFLVNFQLEPLWTVIAPALAAASSIVAAGAALRENDLGKIMAYSVICQTGFILLGLACGQRIGAAGGLLYLLMQALASCGMILCAGIIEQAAGVRDINKMGGLVNNLPLVTAAFCLCALSVMGLPPFGGFFAKYMIISGAVQSGNIWLAALFLLASLMTVFYLLRVIVKVFFGPLVNHEASETSWEMVISVGLLGLLSLAAGIGINMPSDIAGFIVESLGRW